MNCKDPNNLKPVRFLEYNEDARYNPVDFEEYLLEEEVDEKVKSKVKNSKNPQRNRKKSQLLKKQLQQPSKKVSRVFRGNLLDPIESDCAWMRHCKGNAKTLLEPEWILMLSILIRCKRGERACKEWSKPYDAYSEDETMYKAYRALEKGPVTCERVNNTTDVKHCETCPYFNKITSPIVLGKPKKITV